MQELLIKYLQKAVPYLTVLVVIAVAYLGAKITWGIVEPMPTITVTPIKAVSVNTGSSKSAMSPLPTRNLFGKFVVEEVKVVETPVVEDAPETRLSLQLQGVFASTGGESPGSAVIARSKGARGEYFKVGDNVFGQAKLAQVQTDRVILDRNGRMESLKFDEGPSVGGSSIIKRNEPVANPNANSRNLNFNGPVDTVISAMRTEAVNDPAGLVNRMGLEATGDGYRVTRRARQLMAMGLRAGDMIISVNDMAVGNIENDQLLVDQVLASGEIKVEIQRGSRRFTIYPPMP